MKSKEFYKTTAWKWFSKYVLLYYSTDGAVQCSTGGKWYNCNNKLMHCGHLIKVFDTGGKTNFATAFDFRNVLPQSHQHNVHMGGNELKMLDAIEKIHGIGTYQELRQKARFPFILDKVTLQEISDEYRIKFNELTKTKGNPWK
jgi:hypothetical protein